MEKINPKLFNRNESRESLNPQNQMKHVPGGVKIISVLYYIGAFLGVISGILFIFASGLIGSALGILASLGYFAGIIFIGLGVFGFFVARGLWKGKNWSRIVAIIFASLGTLTAALSMIQGEIVSNIFGLVINFAIGGYLLFSSKVKEAFSHR